MVTINILDILKKYTDMNHRFTQAEIMDILKKEYGMRVDRKTVKRNLMNLLDMDCGVDCTEVPRTGKEGNDTSICTDWYIQREFTDSELRLLIDSVLFSKSIPYRQGKNLIEKLKSLSNIYFDEKIRHICRLPDNQPENKEMFYTIDILNEAINHNKKVGFTYNVYGTDKKLHAKREEAYVVNPYQMAVNNGRYYLVCNYDKYDNLSNYRIDRITNIKILDEKRKPIKNTAEGEFTLPQHMTEHIYMFSGESIRAKFKTQNYIVDQLIDWFGTGIDIKPINDMECIVSVRVNKRAFFCWALQYGMHIEVIEPSEMRNQLAEAARGILKKYQQDTMV